MASGSVVEQWVIAHTELASAPGHPFYQRLNELLESESSDESVEKRCVKFYAAKYGRPSLTPGIYFRSLLIGYFEGIEAERGIAWRLADSLALRRFVGIALDEYTPDHSTISRTRRLLDLETLQTASRRASASSATNRVSVPRGRASAIALFSEEIAPLP